MPWGQQFLNLAVSSNLSVEIQPTEAYKCKLASFLRTLDIKDYYDPNLVNILIFNLVLCGYVGS